MSNLSVSLKQKKNIYIYITTLEPPNPISKASLEPDAYATFT